MEREALWRPPQREVEMNYGSLRGGWSTNVVNVFFFFFNGISECKCVEGLG